MWKELVTDPAFAVIVSSAITAVATAFATIWGIRRSNRPAIKKIASADVYKAWIDDLREEMRKTRKDFNKKIVDMETEIDELEEALRISEEKSKRRLDKLLTFSRQYDVDISDVI
jgi:hypothetical protein